MTDLELQLLTRNTMVLEAIRDILQKSHVVLSAIQGQLQSDPNPNYQYDLSAFPNFNWDTIGASVVERDRYGAAVVTWGGYTFTRRSPQNKFESAIWFSHCTGKGENGENVYVRLITFKRHNNKAEPLPERVLSSLRAPSA